MRMTFAAGLIAAALVSPIALSTHASAQDVGVRFGGDGASLRFRDRDRDWDDRRTVIRERYRGPDVVYRRGGDDCRVIVERRMNRFGERVVRRTRVCD